MALDDWRFGRQWNSFAEMERVLDDFGRALAGFRRTSPFQGRSAPTMNVWSNEDDLDVTCEVPGVEAADIGITVMGDILTVSGRRQQADSSGSDGAAGSSNQSFTFSRSLQLPFRVDSERTEARCRNGVLTVRLHRPASEKPRRVAVQPS